MNSIKLKLLKWHTHLIIIVPTQIAKIQQLEVLCRFADIIPQELGAQIMEVLQYCSLQNPSSTIHQIF